MITLNFPPYQTKLQNKDGKSYIFCAIRKKYVYLQPEEFVRQHVVQFLFQEKNIPISLINVEKKVVVEGLIKRYDVIVYHTDGSVSIVVECKAPKVNITQKIFDQIAQYNLKLKADYLMITNGLSHYFCRLDYENECYQFLENIPKYSPKD